MSSASLAQLLWFNYRALCSAPQTLVARNQRRPTVLVVLTTVPTSNEEAMLVQKVLMKSKVRKTSD